MSGNADPRQEDLFAPPMQTPRAVTAGHPPSVMRDTSALAADAIKGRTSGMNARVLAFVVGRGTKGATQDEASEFLKVMRPTVCARFWELEKIGLIRQTEERRNTRSKRLSTVYAATQTGIARCEVP